MIIVRNKKMDSKNKWKNYNMKYSKNQNKIINYKKIQKIIKNRYNKYRNKKMINKKFLIK